MTSGTALALLGAATPLVVLMVLTAVGEVRRGGRPAVCLVAGVLFPLTWTVWYVADRRLSRGAPRA